MNYLFMAIVYCETSLVSTNPEKVCQYFKSIEEQEGENYISNNDDYWISIIELDKPKAKEISFDSSKEFLYFMNGFNINNIDLETKLKNHI